MPISQEFAHTQEYAALVRNQYAGLTESPHLFTIKARLYELMHVLLDPHDPLASILFNLFDEMNTIRQLDEDSAWILEEARDIAYVYTRHFHDSHPLAAPVFRAGGAADFSQRVRCFPHGALPGDESRSRRGIM